MDTSLVTAVVTGVIIFIGSQYLLKLIIEPAVELHRTIGEIGSALSIHHDVLIVPTKHDEKHRKVVAEKMELLAGRLFGGVMALPGYNLIRRPFSLPSKIEVLDAVDKIQSIVGISQSGAAWTLEKNWRLIIEIFEHLRSPIPKSLEADKEHLLKNEWNKRDSA